MRCGPLLFFVLGLVPADTFGQTLDSATVVQLQPRINTQEAVRVGVSEGRMVVSDPELRFDGLAYAGGSDRIALDRISRMQVRGSAAATGALIGGTILGVGGLVVGLSTTGDCAEGFLAIDIFCESSAGDVLAVTMVSAATGAAIGALIGLPARKWKTVFDRREPPPVGLAVLPAPNSLGLAARFRF